MKRWISVLWLIVMLLALAVAPAAAEKPQPESIQWNVHWGVQDETGWWATRWFLSADPAMQVKSFVYFRWFASGGDVVFTILPTGMQSNFGADPAHIYSPTAFQLMAPGATHSFAGMSWNSGTCMPGPKIEFNIAPEQRITITNTTSKSLWVFNDSEPNEGKEIKPGDTIIRKAGGLHNGIHLQVTPSMESWNTCASLFWWLSD